ncbi:threonine ammonia-lyase, biosynthetic [Hydrogenovibrio marinus]|uniref:L-threonine dehydratase n=1 Tax=Hydrogenovibrio marinus TaxID=28885 RepID=A0A067A1Y3_HYDMR|nr:threonine ammonia-lyase, biosynthetic [Hydrogenovibrio marinus]KDN96616.1 threonine dehydratase [Hydrogenovibrio marinus]BBN60175.1 L-threonine dehydratase [Hydrogenovibrio marinus]
MPEKILRQVLSVPVYEIAEQTPLEKAPLISQRLRNQVWLKREDLQPVFSFKLRGAYNRMLHLTEEEKQRGIIAASAGNHAQGVAMTASKMGIKATIVMPQTTPAIKVNSVRNWGGNAVLFGDTYDEAAAHAEMLREKDNLTYIAPYDDEYVIAGQGTIALELLRQGKDLDVIFVPVGGGGLIAGISAVIKQVSPKTRVVGVEPEDAACMTEALKAGKRVVLDSVGIFADGVAVAQVGKIPFRIAQTCVDEMVTVKTDEICAAVKDIFEDTRAIAEPAGALALAGMKKFVEEKGVSDLKMVAIVSGANMNFDRLRHISERTEIGEKREAIFAVTIPETPGSFKKFCEFLGDRRAITEFNYRFADSKRAVVFVGVRTEGGFAEKEQLKKQMLEAGYQFEDMSDNEMAKLHLRYMVGGHAPGIKNEILYRFQFPERPGALLQFLIQMSEEWNISLFHYRNHGAAYGRVLIGVQVPPEQEEAFEHYLKNLGYPYDCEQDNIGYDLFLKPID